MDEKEIVTWMGNDITTLSREELIGIVKWYVSQYEEFMSPKNCRARALGTIEMMKKGEY